MSPGERLRARREALGISQTAFGRIAGVYQSTVWRWEAGRRPIPRWVDVVLDTLEHDQGSMVTALAWLMKMRKGT